MRLTFLSFLATLSLSLVGNASLVLPQDKTGVALIKSLSSAVLTKFQVRISDLQKTYTYKQGNHVFSLVSNAGSSGCSSAATGSVNFQINWSSKREGLKLTEEIIYSGCGTSNFLKETLVREGQKVAELTNQEVLNITRPLQITEDQTSFVYTVSNAKEILFSILAYKESTTTLVAEFKVQGQLAIVLKEVTTPSGQKQVSLLRNPFTTLYTTKSGTYNNSFSSRILLGAFESDVGPVYFQTSSVNRVSESNWNQTFNDLYVKRITDGGMSALLSLASEDYLPKAKKVVSASGANERLVQELTEIRDLVTNGQNLNRVRDVLNSYIELANSGLLNDKR